MFLCHLKIYKESIIYLWILLSDKTPVQLLLFISLLPAEYTSKIKKHVSIHGWSNFIEWRRFMNTEINWSYLKHLILVLGAFFIFSLGYNYKIEEETTMPPSQQIASPPAPQPTGDKATLKTKTRDLINIRDRCIALIKECGNEDSDQTLNKFKGHQDEWYESVDDFLNSDLIRNDPDFKHWRLHDSYCEVGVSFEYGEIHTPGQKAYKETPPRALSPADFATLQRKLGNLNYYLTQMKRKSKGLPVLCPSGNISR